MSFEASQGGPISQSVCVCVFYHTISKQRRKRTTAMTAVEQINRVISSARSSCTKTIACGMWQSPGLGSLILLALTVGISTKTREDHGWERYHCVNTLLPVFLFLPPNPSTPTPSTHPPTLSPTSERKTMTLSASSPGGFSLRQRNTS